MTATEELRRLLDERGVEWRLVNGDCILWTDDDGATYSARDGFTFAGPDGTVTVYNMTPEQAIAATLGPGTCHMDFVGYTLYEDRYQCRSCCWSIWRKHGTRPHFNYCPNCGRKVSGDGEE